MRSLVERGLLSEFLVANAGSRTFSKQFKDSGACTFFRGVPHPHLLGVQLLNLFCLFFIQLPLKHACVCIPFTYKSTKVSDTQF